MPIQTTEASSKFLKTILGFAIVVYFGMTLLIEYFVLPDTTAGFVNEPNSSEAQSIAMVLGLVGLGSLIAQFILPKRIQTQPAADLVRYALCESIAIFGLLLFLLNSQFVYAWSMIGVAFVALIFGGPSKKAL